MFCKYYLDCILVVMDEYCYSITTSASAVAMATTKTEVCRHVHYYMHTCLLL